MGSFSGAESKSLNYRRLDYSFLWKKMKLQLCLLILVAGASLDLVAGASIVSKVKMDADDAYAHGVKAEDRGMEADDAYAHGVAAKERGMDADDAYAHGVRAEDRGMDADDAFAHG